MSRLRRPLRSADRAGSPDADFSRGPGSGTARQLRTAALAGVLLAALTVIQACGVGAGYVAPDHPSISPADVAAEGERAWSVFLIGDAGLADSANSAPLRAMSADAAAGSSEALIAVLGDNVYPDGLAAEGTADRARGEAILDRQIDAILTSGRSGIFIPGNHDWEGMGTDGAETIRGQQAYVERKTKGVIRFMPPNAEPGPVVLLQNDRVQVIALDTQWWLHEGGKPYYPGSAFAQEAAGADPEGITMGLIADSLAGLLRGYHGPLTIILGHHPLETHGPHGGFFTWKDHIFPLTNIEAWLWLPLPIVGSVYPLARLAGFSEQDMSNSRYAKFIEMIDEAIRVNRPVVYASGHEHALQVLRPSADRLYLVSGNGILDHSSAVTGGEHTLFASELPGYMRLDFFMASGDSSASAADSASPSGSSSAPPGGVLLSVVGTPGTGKPVELYRYWVVPPGDRSRDTLR